jgi:hypothetical protein
MLTKTAFLIALLLLTGLVALPGTKRIAWNPKERPRLQLSRAMEIAQDTLNTNEGLPKDDDTFYCLGGSIAITSSNEGDWSFTFGSKEKGQRWVIVKFNGQARVRKDPPVY